MLEQQIQTLISSGVTNSQVEVKANGNSFSIRVISDEFDGLNSLKRQQLIYAKIAEKIRSGEVHAVNFRLYTLNEWEKESKFTF